MRKSLFILTLSLLALTACGKTEDPFNLPNSPGGAATAGPALDATVKGKIAFQGTAPTPKKIQTSADPGCKNPDLVSEEVVVSDGGLENVILYVSGGDIQGKSFPVTSTPVTLDQMGCHYVPHALTIQVGQPLKITNSDDTAHNVHAWAEVNMPFNEPQSHKGDSMEKKFTKEEMHFPVRCDVHNWMNAFVGVFNHPLHTTSKKGGAYELKLPAGNYEITAVHEKYGEQKQMVQVAANGSADLNFTFKAQ